MVSIPLLRLGAALNRMSTLRALAIWRESRASCHPSTRPRLAYQTISQWAEIGKRKAEAILDQFGNKHARSIFILADVFAAAINRCYDPSWRNKLSIDLPLALSEPADFWAWGESLVPLLASSKFHIRLTQEGAVLGLPPRQLVLTCILSC